uniref:FkbM family methyltransferase n=1 Tax=Phenylobacterium glaciei TaxID=2803784 RepID=A0A974SAP3_9CAUL|nr:FkbM family methyltransferase [Phenylobacterium glaciei]
MPGLARHFSPCDPGARRGLRHRGRDAAGDAEEDLRAHGPRLRLRLRHRAGGQGAPRPGGHRRRAATHPVVTLDGYCAANGIGRVDFIRMDIEGASRRR